MEESNKKAEEISALMEEWIRNVNQTVRSCSGEYEKNKNVFNWFIYQAIVQNEPDILRKKECWNGKNSEIFDRAASMVSGQLKEDYPLTALPQFRSVMNQHFEEIHKQSMKWTESSHHLSVYGFDLYQILASELGRDFMYLKDQDGDEVADVILFSFSELMEKDIPEMLTMN